MARLRKLITSLAEGWASLGERRFEGERQPSVSADADCLLLPKNLPADSDFPTGPTEIETSNASTQPPLLRTLHIAEYGAYVHRRGGRIVVCREDTELFEIPLEKLDQVCVAQEGSISFSALREFLSRKVSFVLTGGAGEPVGWLDDLTGGNVTLHREQFRRADDPDFSLAAACAMIGGKIANSRLILRRYARHRQNIDREADRDLADLEHRLHRANNLDALRGYEGAAARRYFSAIGHLLGPTWDFNQRNRRPPRDPVNVLLSYGYAVLFQNVLTLVARRGLHPQIGALHTPADRHPALVSDLMEEFRPLVVDAVVLKLLLNTRLKPEHFEFGVEDYPCRLTPGGRRLFVQSLEEKLDAPLQHPQSGKAIDLRRAIAGQASLWAECVGRRIPAYTPFVLH
jgi:CRISPR-associated protein Cas1